MRDIVIEINNLKKKYRLGLISGGTLNADIQSWWSRLRGKEDPNKKIGEKYEENEEFWALSGMELKVYKGDTVGIIGSNGAGKSTLLKILSKVTAPSEGEIRIKGRISSMLEVGTGFHGELTGRENIYLNGAILGMSRREVDNKIEDIIEFSECRKFIDTPVKRYSSGMYVKLAFAVAAHLDSEILVMDEVLAVGDMKFQEKCLGKMGDVACNDGKTVLYVSHNMNTIQQLCNRCIVLDKGKIIFDGGVEDAIKIYMGNMQNSDPTVDLSQYKRTEEFANGSAKMTDFELLNQKKSCFSIHEKVKFRLKYESYKDSDTVCLRVIIRYVDGSPVTMTTSAAKLKLKQGDTQSAEFLIDLNSIVPGKYSMSFVLYEVNCYGAHNMCDGVKECFCFEVIGDETFNNKMEWTHRYWGHMALPEIQVLKNEN